MEAKRLKTLAILGFACFTSHAQGTINFSNAAAG